MTVTNEFIVTGPGRYRSWFCICLALPSRFQLKTTKRKQELWQRGSINTERGAVATWSVIITNELIVTDPVATAPGFVFVDPR